MDKLTGKGEPEPTKQPKAKAKEPKRPSVKQLNGARDGLQSILDDLVELASTDPYLADAQAFVTQAIVCLEKQIVTEGGRLDPKPEPGPEPPKAK